MTALVQPMDQGVIASLKEMYRSSVRRLIEEEIDLKSFLKKYTILDAIYDSASAWERVKKTTLIRSWKKIFPSIDDSDEFSGFSQQTIMAEELAKMAVEVSGGEEVDAENINSWFECDNDLPAFEKKSDEDIVRSVMEGDAESEGEDDEEGGEEATADCSQSVSHGAALVHVESLLDYIEGQDDALLSDKLVLRKLRSQIIKKQQCAKKQTTMKDFLKSN